MIFDNVRTETMNRGDMNAMLAACQLGRDRFLRLVAALRRRGRHERRLRLDGLLGADAARRDREDPRRRVRPDRGGSTTTRGTAGVRLRVETKVIVEGDEITIDLTGSNAEVPTGYNVPFEGSLLVGCVLRGPDDPARRGDLPRARAAERRRLPPRQGDRPEGDDLQPELPARLLLALLPGAAGRRQHHPRARGRAAGPGHRRELGRDPLLRVRRASTRQPASTGSTSR